MIKAKYSEIIELKQALNDTAFELEEKTIHLSDELKEEFIEPILDGLAQGSSKIFLALRGLEVKIETNDDTSN